MMRLASRLKSGIFFSWIALLALPCQLFSQQSASIPAASTPVMTASIVLPDAPQPQQGSDMDLAQDQQTQPSPQPAPPVPSQTPTAQGSSSSQTGAQQTGTQTQQQKADQQIKEQEKQRTLGVLPAFNVSYRADAVSLTAGQKLKLAFRSATDPVAFGIAFIVAGEHEALDDDTGFGWGIEGYGKRSGAAYLDAFDGAIIGNGILPSILHQDPRYFRLGHGTTKHRLLYALATNVMCKHDNTHKWEPNYSNVGGNIISGAISNLYYPSSNSGIGQTFTNGLTVTAEGGLGSVFQEFWPDISRKFLHKDPTNGLDAEARAQDAAKKRAKDGATQPEPPSPK
jgi:hypothetical protein